MLILVFLISLTLSVFVVMLVSRPAASQKTVHQRLTMIGNKVVEVPEEVIHLAEKVKTKESFTDRLSNWIKSYEIAEGIEQLILFSGSKMTVGSVVLSSAGCGIAFAFIANWFSAPLIVILPVAGLGLAAPFFLLNFKRKKRLKKFEDALPDAIELMARALRAGHSMASSIEIIAEQSPEPLAGEFGLCFQQQKFGIPFRDALIAMTQRMPSNDLNFLVTAVLIQKETGGDLTDILDRTTHVIRERVRIAGEVRTYTAQGRLTGWILSGMPIAMMVLINFLTPGYSRPLFHDPIGHLLVGAGVVLILIGGLIIRKIVDIKV